MCICSVLLAAYKRHPDSCFCTWLTSRLMATLPLHIRKCSPRSNNQCICRTCSPGWRNPRTARTPPRNPTAQPSHRTGSRTSCAGWQWDQRNAHQQTPAAARRKLGNGNSTDTVSRQRGPHERRHLFSTCLCSQKGVYHVKQYLLPV